MLQNIPVNEIFTALRKTPAGRSLRQSPRFAPYRHSSESLILWRRILGPSGITYYHMKHVYSILGKFLKVDISARQDIFSSQDIRWLLLGAACHDFGEAILEGEDSVGDIVFFLKNKNHVEKEFIIFQKVLQSLSISDSLKKDLTLAYQEVVMNDSSHLFRYFQSLERTEYLMTALTVFRNYQQFKRLTNSKLLVGNVLAVHIDKVTQFASQHAAIDKFLKKNSHHITQAYKTVSDDYRNYALDNHLKSSNIDDSWKAWQRFLEI